MPAQILLQRKFIQIEACNTSSIGSFNLPLQQAMTATDLRHRSRARDQAAAQTLQTSNRRRIRK